MIKALRFASSIFCLIGLGAMAHGWYDAETHAGYYPDFPWYYYDQKERSAPATEKPSAEALSQLLESHIKTFELERARDLARIERLEEVVLTERQVRITRLESDLANISFWLRTFSVAIIGLVIFVIQEVVRRSYERRCSFKATNGRKKQNGPTPPRY